MKLYKALGVAALSLLPLYGCDKPVEQRPGFARVAVTPISQNAEASGHFCIYTVIGQAEQGEIVAQSEGIYLRQCSMTVAAVDAAKQRGEKVTLEGVLEGNAMQLTHVQAGKYSIKMIE